MNFYTIYYYNEDDDVDTDHTIFSYHFYCECTQYIRYTCNMYSSLKKIVTMMVRYANNVSTQPNYDLWKNILEQWKGEVDRQSSGKVLSRGVHEEQENCVSCT